MTALALASSACSATETVTISEDAITSATSTALRDGANSQQGDQSSGQGSDTTTASPPADDVVDDPADDPIDAEEQTTTRRDGSATESGCAFSFVDGFGDIQIEITFANPVAELSDVSVSYDVFDDNGELLESGQTFFESLASGEGVRINVDTLIDDPAAPGAQSGISCELTAIEPLAFSFDGTRPGAGDSCRFVEVDSFDDIQVELTVTNPFDDSADIIVDYVLRGADGVRFGESVAFLEVFPGESVTVEDDTVTEFPAWANESTFSCQILSIDDF